MPNASFKGADLPESIFKNGVLNLSEQLFCAHKKQLDIKGWASQYGNSSAHGAIGGMSQTEANNHFINRFLNSSARAQYVIADPDDSQPDIRDMVLDQMADGRIFILDLASGHGAGTLAMLSLLAELRIKECIPKLPLNVHVYGIDYSADALTLYQVMHDELLPWLKTVGIEVSLGAWPCDLTIAGELNEILDDFFESARKTETRRFLCVLSAVSGLGQEGIEKIVSSLQLTATRLSSCKNSSSWLWIEPSTTNSWFSLVWNSIRCHLQRIPSAFKKKSDTFELKSSSPTLTNPMVRKFEWLDPYSRKNVQSRVMVIGFRNA